MPRKRESNLQITRFDDHQIISQPNPLRSALRHDNSSTDDPVARAEAALASLSSEFSSWMATECDRLTRAHVSILANGINADNGAELFRAAHDIKGDAATFGYPNAAVIADSLCRVIEHAPDLANVPGELIAHHVNAIQAVVREQSSIASEALSGQLARRLCGVADEFLTRVNRERPDHLQAIMSPSLVPAS